jgi:hypothetical protein
MRTLLLAPFALAGRGAGAGDAGAPPERPDSA